jgi:Gas vesicle synthesis protein GvpL/GvpF
VNQYLYAIVDRLPARWRPPTAGIGGASVVPRRVDDVVVLGSLLETVPSSSPRTLALHQDVVGTVVDAGAALPLPYGTVVPAADLHAWVSARRRLIAAALESVRGCVEVTVKLLRLDGSVVEHLARGRGHRGHATPVGPEEAELQSLADALVERAVVPCWRYRPSGSAGNVAASVAFLVDRRDLTAFLARIAPVASHAAGVAVVPTGPSAPYSFVPQLERAPTARVSTEAIPSLGRRAG